MFNPVITARQMRWRVPRIVSTSVLVIALFIVVVSFIAWFGPLTVQQAQTLTKTTPQYVQSLSTRYGIQLGDLSTPLEAFASKLHNNPMSILHSLLAGTRQAFGVIGQVIGATTEFALVMVLVPIYFFFAWQFDRISRPFASCRPVRGSAFFKFCAAWIMRSADLSAAGFLSGC